MCLAIYTHGANKKVCIDSLVQISRSTHSNVWTEGSYSLKLHLCRWQLKVVGAPVMNLRCTESRGASVGEFRRGESMEGLCKA